MIELNNQKCDSDDVPKLIQEFDFNLWLDEFSVKLFNGATMRRESDLCLPPSMRLRFGEFPNKKKMAVAEEIFTIDLQNNWKDWTGAFNAYQAESLNNKELSNAK